MRNLLKKWHKHRLRQHATPYASLQYAEIANAPALFTFAARNAKPGKFSFFKSKQEGKVNRFMFNCAGNRWYVKGIDGLGKTFNKTARMLRRMEGIDNSVFIGSSMGAYGALLFGTHCGARRIIGFGSEIITNLPGSYSRDNLSHLKSNSRYYRLDKHIARSQAQIDLFAGECSPVDLFCAAAANRYANVRIHIIADADHAVVHTIKNRELLQPLTDRALKGLKLILPEDIYSPAPIREFLKRYRYSFNAAGLRRFASDYMQFFCANRENITPQHYYMFFQFFYKAKFFTEGQKLLMDCQQRFGEQEETTKRIMMLLHRAKRYKDILAYEGTAYGDVYYFKTSAAVQLKQMEIAAQHLADGYSVAQKTGNSTLQKSLHQLQKTLNIPAMSSPPAQAAQEMTSIMLTTYPAHKSRNVGDYLISDATLRLIRARRPDYAPVTLFRETPLAAYPPASVKAILAPGFTVLNETYPKFFRLYDDRKTLPPFYPVGCSFQHPMPSHDAFDSYVYTPETLDFLKTIAERAGPLPCRDALIVRLLERNSIPATYSGDMAIYDEQVLGSAFTPPAGIRSLVFTIQHHPKYIPQSLHLLTLLKEAFPDAARYVALHSKPNAVTQEVCATSEPLGFETLHQYGDITNLARYDGIDLHVGYRLHGHIAFLRKRKPSLLLIEDARSFGLAHTPGTKAGCFAALDAATDAPLKEAPEHLMEYLRRQQACRWEDYVPLFAFIDKTHRDYIVPTFNRLADIL